MHTSSNVSSKPELSGKNGTSKRSKRINIYLRSPGVLDMLDTAIRERFIEAPNASQRIEQLLTNEVRRLVPKFRKAGIVIPDSVAEIFLS